MHRDWIRRREDFVNKQNESLEKQKKIMYLALALSFIVIFAIFLIALTIYEKYVEKLDISDVDRVFYLAIATLLWPLTLIVSVLFGLVKLANFFKKM